jgi:indolepyruvate ferredoxin oxidoreductase beta subunit
MSQRGGDVQSHLRISDREIYSDLIPEGDADIILSVEPMESLRYLPFLSPEGWLVTNTTPYKNIPNYPDLEKIMEEIGTLPHHVAIDADGIAKELKNPLGMNMVMTGGASLFMDIDFEMLKKGVRYIFGRKGDEVVEKNIATLEAGRKYAEEHRSS